MEEAKRAVSAVTGSPARAVSSALMPRLSPRGSTNAERATAGLDSWPGLYMSGLLKILEAATCAPCTLLNV